MQQETAGEIHSLYFFVNDITLNTFFFSFFTLFVCLFVFANTIYTSVQCCDNSLIPTKATVNTSAGLYLGMGTENRYFFGPVRNWVNTGLLVSFRTILLSIRALFYLRIRQC